jgi:hypothetical protein
MSGIIIKNKTFFLFYISILTVSVSLQATEKISDVSSCIYIAKDAQIYGKEQLLAKPSSRQNIQKKTIQTTEEKTLSRPQKDIDKGEQVTIFPDFPFAPSSSSLKSGKASATVVSQQRTAGHQSMAKTIRENIYTYIENSDLSLYTPKQRQRLSIAATQCGVLTSFSPHSPTELITE